MTTELPDQRGVLEGQAPVGNALLYYREIGDGTPVVVLHGGPDFDHWYLLPEMDRLSDSFRVIYYDQRGRGRSAEGVQPEDVDIRSDVDDLDSLRRWFGLDSFVLLGHSWGGVLAMEYATRSPDHVSHLILMSSAPASHQDLLMTREHIRGLRTVGEIELMESIRSTDRYQDGDLEAETDYYRIHFRATLPQAEQLERVVGRLRTHFTNESVRKARAIEDRLYEQTWLSPDYDLLPALSRLHIPALVLNGQDDLIPVEAAAHIANSMPLGRLTVVPGCGHFAYLESPDMVQAHITAFIQDS